MNCIRFADTEEGRKAYEEYKKKHDAIFEERYKKECIKPDDPRLTRIDPALVDAYIENHNRCIKESLLERDRLGLLEEEEESKHLHQYCFSLFE